MNCDSMFLVWRCISLGSWDVMDGAWGKGPRERGFLCVDCVAVAVAISLLVVVVVVVMDGERCVLVFLRGGFVGYGVSAYRTVGGKVGGSTPPLCFLKCFAASGTVLV